MTGLYLKETAKLFDIVDLTICCSLYKICNGNQFEYMKGTDFVDFMNLKKFHGLLLSVIVKIAVSVTCCMSSVKR